ncbi:conserved hypothetical protein [Methylobacillus flagellatus KT]|uniref:Dicarboxylate transport domain-containing protein n=2 Tax=Methylobacillus flagellatus TaxID=405 RepID=Q1H060_METFK|nr:conserved hypothetical protein [Methylobacillus flagellatus KT]
MIHILNKAGRSMLRPLDSLMNAKFVYWRPIVLVWVTCGIFAWISPALAISTISIEADTVVSPSVSLRKVKAELGLDGHMDLQAELRQKEDADWQALALGCAQAGHPAADEWRCERGEFRSANVRLPFNLLFKQIKADVPQYQVVASVRDASFSNQAGTQAAEKLNADVVLDLRQQADGWQWQAMLDWQGGELFWQPWYFAEGGHQLVANGHYAGDELAVEAANVTLAKVGKAALRARWKAGSLKDLFLDADRLELSAFYSLLLQPLLVDSALNKLDIAGQASVRFEMRQGDPVSALLVLNDVDLEDLDGRFALHGLNSRIPWSYDESHVAQLAYGGGHFLKIPLGEASVLADLNRYAVTMPQLYLPILDGALSLTDVSATRAAGHWHWHLRANLVPISMPALSHALGWPRMEGKVAAAIPMVTYSAGSLTANGDLLFQMFNGNVVVRNLHMQTPLEAASRLHADLEVRQLDLGDITRTFSFGAIEGKLDGDVRGLELSNWQPVGFDARLYSSPGSYRKKISQRAVENITALGGAGAAAAIQRSLLRFFSEFNYKRIGWHCQLRNDICQMGGVENTPQGYVIVEGSGIPAITVMGYNHHVGWSDLLARLRHVTENNPKPVID